MLTTPNNWPLTSYNNDEWTEVAAGLAVLSSIVISNTDPDEEIVVQLRAAGVRILAPQIVSPKTSHAVDLRNVIIKAGESLDFQADAAGAEILASGAT